MDRWRAMERAQGGDPVAPLPRARESEVVAATGSGVVTGLDAMAVGIAARLLGAGRLRQGEPVQAGAGVRWHVRPGDTVRAGQPLFTLYTDDPDRFGPARAALAGACVLGGTHRAGPLVIERIGPVPASVGS
jgi:thymidine phosphorylase